MLRYDEDIKLRSTDGKVIGNIFLYIDGITLGIYVGIDLGSLHGSFGGLMMARLRVYCLGVQKFLLMVT